MKAYKSLENLTNFTNFLPNFTKFYQIRVQISDLHNFVAISNCCNLRVKLIGGGSVINGAYPV